MTQNLTLTIRRRIAIIIDISKTGRPRRILFEADVEPATIKSSSSGTDKEVKWVQINFLVVRKFEEGSLGYGDVGTVDIGDYEEFGKTVNKGMKFTIHGISSFAVDDEGRFFLMRGQFHNITIDERPGLNLNDKWKNRSGEVDAADFAKLVEISNQTNEGIRNNVHLHSFVNLIKDCGSMGQYGEL